MLRGAFVEAIALVRVIVGRSDKIADTGCLANWSFTTGRDKEFIDSLLTRFVLDAEG